MHPLYVRAAFHSSANTGTSLVQLTQPRSAIFRTRKKGLATEDYRGTSLQQTLGDLKKHFYIEICAIWRVFYVYSNLSILTEAVCQRDVPTIQGACNKKSTTV